MTYQAVEGSDDIKRLEDDGSVSIIPADPGNADYQRYLSDVAAGVTVLPADPVPPRKTAILLVTAEDVRTTTATVTTLVAWPLAQQTLYTARFTILAIDVGNADCRAWHATATAKRVNNGAVLLGTTQVSSHADAGAATWAITADVSSNDFRIRVTGAAGRTVSWSVVGEVLRARPSGLVD